MKMTKAELLLPEMQSLLHDGYGIVSGYYRQQTVMKPSPAYALEGWLARVSDILNRAVALEKNNQ